MATKIEWTDKTWNPVTGCTKISSGCVNCYAERMAIRLKAMGNAKYANGFKVALHENELERPLGWKHPSMIFVNSMSDLFHEDVPDDFIIRIFEVMKKASQHIFQVLTKRSARLLEIDKKIDWPRNVWAGVTVEDKRYRERIDHLRVTSAHVKFLSLEPLLSAIPSMDLSGIDWVITGGESGIGARPIEEAWVIDIRDQCTACNVAFFFKQWGGRDKKKNGRMLEDRIWEEFPISHRNNESQQTK